MCSQNKAIEQVSVRFAKKEMRQTSNETRKVQHQSLEAKSGFQGCESAGFGKKENAMVRNRISGRGSRELPRGVVINNDLAGCFTTASPQSCFQPLVVLDASLTILPSPRPPTLSSLEAQDSFIAVLDDGLI